MEELLQERDINRITLNNFGKVIVIVFYAEWHEHSRNYLNQFKHLVKLMGLPSSDVIFTFCDADKVGELPKYFGVNSVPTVVFTDTLKKHLAVLENEQPAVVFDRLEQTIKA